MWMPLICIYNTLEVIQHPGGEIFLGNIITWRYWPPKVLYVDVEGFWNTHTVRWERTHVNAKHQFYVFMNNLSFFPWEITVQKITFTVLNLLALLIEEYKHFVKNDRFMFCLTDVRVFSGRHKHNLKDKDTNTFVHKISHFGL